VDFNRDGSLIAVGLYDASVGVWDTITGQLVAERHDHSNVVFPQFAPTRNWVLTSSVDRTVTLWDAISGEMLLYLPAHTDLVYAVLTDDGRNLILSDAIVRDGQPYSILQIWSVEQGDVVAEYQLLYDDAGFLIPGLLDLHVDGNLLAFWTANEQLLLIDPISGRHLNTLIHPNHVQRARFSPDGNLIASSTNGNALYFWNAETGESVFTLETESVQDMIFSPDGSMFISAHSDGSVRLWGVPAT
jgi:WD40 repeat protein